jgi:putative phosphoesterase
MKIGVISDTHGHLDPQVASLFGGVEHILHGGDIGPPAVILELEQIAPVTAVLGNNDTGPEFRDTEVIELGGRKFLVHHIVDVRSPAEDLRRRLERERPDVVVFGHTHKPFQAQIGGTLFLNPGYAGRHRFQLARSVAVIEYDAGDLRVEFKPL